MRALVRWKQLDHEAIVDREDGAGAPLEALEAGAQRELLPDCLGGDGRARVAGAALVRDDVSPANEGFRAGAGNGRVQ